MLKTRSIYIFLNIYIQMILQSSVNTNVVLIDIIEYRQAVNLSIDSLLEAAEWTELQHESGPLMIMFESDSTVSQF